MAAAPRIVFFGLPHTGKTALLHAFADPDAPVSLLPPGKTGEMSRVLPSGVVLCDVDGRSAKEIISDPVQIQRNEATANDVRSADAIVLALDASASSELMLGLFAEFALFLEGFEKTRSHGREVGGLPIYLTLTKCDTLFRPGDDPNEWLRRVEAKKQSVRTAFEDYLAETGHGGPVASPFGFGSIEVHVAATAIQFPPDHAFHALRAPFGVEELQEDCTQAATAFRRRIESSHRQLRWTVAGSSVLVGTMLATLLGLFAFSPTADEDRLGRRVQLYRQNEGPSEVRLADKRFDRNRKELEAIREDYAFDELPPEVREFIDNRLREFTAYRDFREKFQRPRIGPAEVRTGAELDRLDAELNSLLVPPPEFAAAWSDTEAIRLFRKWKTDAGLVRQAEATLNEWYRGLIRRGTALLLASTLDAGWRQDATGLFAESDRPPFDPTATIAGSERLPVARGAALSYGEIFDFDRIDQARGDWADTRDRLAAMRTFGDLLGMTGGPNALLVFPEPTSDPAVSARLGADLLPKVPAVAGSISQFPDPIRGELQKRLRQSQEAGAKHVQTVVRAKLGGESREGWGNVARWLAEPDAKAWGQLLGRVGRWGEFDSADPLEEAVAFLKRDRFELDFANLEVTIPNDLRDRRLIPNGPLVVRQGTKELSFRTTGEPQTSASATGYRFTADGESKLTVRPGDEVSASLKLKAGDREFRLEWTNGGSVVYQFESLHREPTLATELSERATGVKLSAAALPRMPLVLRIQ
ncbi:GTPase domain-containing protein [Limnoglobus roseus]|uniref:Uncharacterized protein n=1 Tax=Limnoglobus roseus TaxID=2598579 RepID=A0A5C1ANZ1_9BACT|nr:GTPase domain-containing protein [Limnoglobus roseus]QEL21119.1 hypothetical protein PX52LOC_08249 [Limnoglobus roseus]